MWRGIHVWRRRASWQRWQLGECERGPHWRQHRGRRRGPAVCGAAPDEAPLSDRRQRAAGPRGGMPCERAAAPMPATGPAREGAAAASPPPPTAAVGRKPLRAARVWTHMRGPNGAGRHPRESPRGGGSSSAGRCYPPHTPRGWGGGGGWPLRPRLHPEARVPRGAPAPPSAGASAASGASPPPGSSRAGQQRAAGESGRGGGGEGARLPLPPPPPAS